MSRPLRTPQQLSAMTLPALRGHLGDLDIEEMTPAERGELVRRMGQHLRSVADDVVGLLAALDQLRAENQRLRDELVMPRSVGTIDLNLEVGLNDGVKRIERDEDGRIVAVVPEF